MEIALMPLCLPPTMLLLLWFFNVRRGIFFGDAAFEWAVAAGRGGLFKYSSFIQNFTRIHIKF